MQRPDGGERAAAIAVHDVSPATWRECEALLALLDAAGATPISLLIVPDFHHRAPVTHDRAFVHAMEARLARGDELVLHGFFHLDEAPAPRAPADWFARRMLTRAEGEFAALDARACAERLERGVAMFDALGWELAGFVPPAWLLGSAARDALVHCAHPFEYVTVKRGIYRLPRWDFERTANLWYSPSSAPRRLLSRWLIHRELRRARATPLLRLSLHPQDARVPDVMRHWRRLVDCALSDRVPVTKREWSRRAVRFREPVAPAATARVESSPLPARDAAADARAGASQASAAS